MRPFLIAMLAFACAGGTPPKRVLASYLEAEQQGRYAEAHALLSASDQEAHSLEIFAHDHLRAGPVWLEVAARTQFQLGKVETLDTHVVVNVDAKHLDFATLAENLPGMPTDVLATSPDPGGAMRAHVRRSLDAAAYPVVTESLTYALREEGGEWRVWLGLDRQDASVAAVLAARAAMTEGDGSTARAAWEAVLALPEDPQGAVAALKAEARAALSALPAP